MSNLNLEPFELSKWKDEMVEEEAPETEENKYVNIYSGLGTDENDLTFWYMPRNWKDWQWVNFIKSEDDINKVTVDITPPEKRIDKLVHVDFSTSNLIFEPNTYYTFLLKLDFSIPNAKLPNWKVYEEANTGLNHHYLVSLVRKNVPNSTWHMPKPIFDSSLAISYGVEGFNLEDCFFATPEEEGQLFIYTDKDNNKQQVYLIGHLKTNNFLKEASTLGMWSFLESWINDYWKANMSIYVFKDNGDENEKHGSIYRELYHKIENVSNTEITVTNNDNQSQSFDLQRTVLEKYSKLFEEETFKRKFSLLYNEINEIIENYYINLMNYIDKFKEVNEDIKEITKDEVFKENYLCTLDSNNSLFSIGKEISNSSKSAAGSLYRYFPNLCFYYILTDMSKKYYTAQTSTALNNIYYLKVDNKITETEETTDIIDKLILSTDILLPIIENEGNIFFYRKEEVNEILFNEEKRNTLIKEQQNSYWNRFFKIVENQQESNSENQIKRSYLYEYCSKLIELINSNDSPFKIYITTNDSTEVTFDDSFLYLLARYGQVLSYIPNFKNFILYMKKQIQDYQEVDDDSFLMMMMMIPSFLFIINSSEINFNKITLNVNKFKQLFFYYNNELSEYGLQMRKIFNVNNIKKIFNYLTEDYLIKDFESTYVLLERFFNPNIEKIDVPFIETNFLKKTKTKRFLKEEKQFIFGHQNAPASFAQNVVLTESTRDAVNTLTFSLYNYYYNNKGEKEENPFINLLQEEDKIKLKYKDKWYDFILTDSSLDSSANKWDYIAKDANIIELSKIGFNKTFNTELDNNIGTIKELSKIAIEGTDWTLDEQKTENFYQGVLRPVVCGKLSQEITAKVTGYYYNDNLARLFENNELSIQRESFIYIFYDDNFSLNNFKIICPKNFDTTSPISEDSYEKINNTLVNIFIYPTIKFYKNGEEITQLKTKDYIISNNLTINLPDIFEEVSFNYGIRANDIVTKPKTHYSIPLKRYVTEYKDVQNDSNTILYGYFENKYSTKPLVKNLIPNGEDFTSLSGWINGTINNIHNLDLYLGAAVREENNISTISPYLNFITSVESGGNKEPHGFACNTDLSYNFTDINHLNPGDEFILRIQVERGQNFLPLTKEDGDNYRIEEQLTLMETMRPYLYLYDNSYYLQSNSSTEVLPKKSQQVMNFIQNERYKLYEKIRSGLEKVTEDEERPYWWSNYNKDFYDLSETLDNQGLVPIYWKQLTKEDIKYGYEYFPCIYVKSKTAKSWKNNGYVDAYEQEERTGINKSYCFSVDGQKALAYLFYGEPKSDFYIRDIEIVLGALFSKIKVSREGSHTYAQLVDLDLKIDNNNNSNIKYYCPFLFTDRDLKKIYNDNQQQETEKIDFIDNKTFFKGATEILEKIFETKEYYEMEKFLGGFRAVPYNIDIDFGDEERNIAHSSENDYNDFDLLMRMRSVWYLHKYSKTDACIFETQGTFYGKPIKKRENNKDEYVYNIYSNASTADFKKSQGYTYEDLLNQHLGLFLTFDQTRYDDGARGNASLAISKIELFRKYMDENGNITAPNKIIESNSTPIFHLYDPIKNENVIKENDIIYEYEGATLNSDILGINYKPVIDLTGEKKNSITITESNCYNILQKIAEIFDAWLIINVEHEDDGRIKMVNDKPCKFIYFINTKYNNNFSGIKYGINLQKITRKVDSNDTITKLIVKNNSNEFGKNGFCSIARSKYNLSGSNSIFNINYLIATGQVPSRIRDILYNEIYPRTQSYGQFLSKTIEERAELITLLSQSQSEAEYNKLIVNDAKEKLADYRSRYETLDIRDKGTNKKINLSYLIYNEKAREKQPQEVKSIVNTIIFYSNLVDGFSEKYRLSTIEYNENLEKYNILQNITESVTKQRDSLINEFQSLCNGGRIKEGAWSSEDYIDDDLYYLDSERQLQEYIQPKVSYDIEVIDVSVLPGWEAYNFNLRDKTTMEDPEIFGYDENGIPVKIDIVITEKSSHLQSPDKNTITVQNYKNQFNDLFQRIASTIQAVEFGTLNYTNKNSDNDINNKILNDEISLKALKTYNRI